MKAEQIELWKAIDEILWNVWDPIGINGHAPRDEYQSYTPTIFSMKINGADKEVIAQKLFELETNSMGLSGNIEHCRQVAEQIVNLK